MSNLKELRKIFGDFAEQYEKLYTDVSEYVEALDIFSEHLPSNAIILDLACGPGNLSSYLATQSAQYKFILTDISERMLKLAQQNLPSAECLSLPIQEVESIDKPIEGIICGFGIPYINDSELQNFINQANKILKENAPFYISWISQHFNSIGQLDHSDPVTHYHSFDHVESLLLKNNFMSIYSLNRERIKANQTKDIEHIIVALK